MIACAAIAGGIRLTDLLGPDDLSGTPSLHASFEGGGDHGHGYDTILLSMILHDWAEDRCRVILQKCWAALPSGGQVIIAELLVNDARTGPPAAALMSLNMLVETEGRNYTPAEYGAWLSDLGFQDLRTVWFEAAGANGAVIGRKP